MKRLFPFVSPILFGVIVFVLGFITPGYNHLNHTISRLAIEKYGWIQSLNFIQLGIGLILTGGLLAKRIQDKGAVSVIRSIFLICGVLAFITAIFPTDPIENVPLDVTLLTPTGLVHISVIFLFLILSPFGIMQLTRVFDREYLLKRFAAFTFVSYILALSGSVVWFIYYFLGMFLEYRGIFQKAITLPVLFWLIIINYEVIRPLPPGKKH